MTVPERPCRIVLIGMMGSGKSTIGRLLSEMTGWPHHDNDELLIGARGATAREIMAAQGEAEMRRAETDALRHGLAQPVPCVLSVAAGTILDEANRTALATAAYVVWLRASPAALADRAAGAAHRPWLDHGSGWFETTAAQRDPLYESAADLAVDVAGTEPAAVAATIVDWLRDSTTCARWLR